MTTPDKRGELRGRITKLVWGGRTDVDGLMALVEQEIADAKKAYHDEITDNERKVWLYREDLDRRLAEARIDELERFLSFELVHENGRLATLRAERTQLRGETK